MRFGRSALSRLLNITAERFVQEINGREAAFNPDGAVPYLRALPKIDDLDSIYFALESAGARLGVVDGHASPSAGTSLVRSDGRVRLDEVHTAYKTGKTLLLTHLQNSHLGIARLARSIECELHDVGIRLRKEVGANLFLTPQNSRGFDPHYDGHDVLILQLAGAKTWNVFDQLLDVPAGMEGGRLDPEQLSERCQCFELAPGSVLYLPRGRPHAAFTTDKNSLHLTMSIIPLTLSDLLLEELKSNSGVYRPLEGSLQRAELMVEPERLAILEYELQQRWLAELNALPETSPWIADDENTVDSVRLVDGLIVELEERSGGDTFKVHMPGASVTFGTHALEAIQFLLAGKSIAASELSLGGRTTESKRRFLNQLIEAGLAAPTRTSP